MMIHGLTTTEAEKLLKKFGANEIREKARRSPLEIFFSQLTNFLIFLLILASLVSFFVGDRLDGLFILLIVFLNSLLGFFQEFKAEKAIEALKKMTLSKVRVRRDGLETEIDSRYLVPGDFFFIEEGVKIPADGVVVESRNLEVNEAALSGESLPVSKGAEGRERERKVFAGTAVAKGRGQVTVAETGMATRFGRIAASLESIKEEPTPLQKRIESLGRRLGIFGIAASLLVLLLSIARGNSVFESFLTSISLAVAAVPEGLPAVITVALALGVERMSKEKAIVRRLTAIEALGSTTLIATDKTGTLTKGEMRVKELWFDGQFFSPKDLTSGESRCPTLEKIVEVAVLCNSANLVFKKDHGSFDVLGDATEGALLLMVSELGRNREDLRENGRLLEEYSFDAEKKMMSVVWQRAGEILTLTKGAPESILAVSDGFYSEGRIVSLSAKKKGEIEKAFKEAAGVGRRVIAFALRRFDVQPRSRSEAERELIFLGFAGIADPPRPEVKAAIKACRDAGIKVVMVTGDSPLTAAAVAEEIGLLETGGEVLTGEELESHSWESLKLVLPKVRIFARINPEQKLRLVRSYQELGEVVAVTGDGVNDALALKQADVGVAMGQTGTDVAKEAADIIVTDDNFASVAGAVEEGRAIFENVKGAVKYLLGCNLGEILAVLLAVALNLPLIFTPLQLLYVNLITDGLPALALAVAPRHALLMKKKPRPGIRLIGKSDLPWFLEVSLLTALITLLSFFLGLTQSLSLGRTLALTAVILVQHLVFVDVWAGEASAWKGRIYRNALFLAAFFLPILVHPFLIYVPSLAATFKLNSRRPDLLAVVVTVSLITLVVSEARKKLAKT